MTLTFEQARQVVADQLDPDGTVDEFVVATWGWGNAGYFTIPAGHRVRVYGPATIEEAELLDNADLPQNVVDRETGVLELVPGLFGALPYPDMVPVGVGNPEDE